MLVSLLVSRPHFPKNQRRSASSSGVGETACPGASLRAGSPPACTGAQASRSSSRPPKIAAL
eukprot:9469531-Pyramimonas_sp.AAC.1